MSAHLHRQRDYDVTKPRIALYQQNWRKHQNTVCWINFSVAQKKGLTFYQSRSNAIIIHNTLPAACIEKVVVMNSEEVRQNQTYKRLKQEQWLRIAGINVVLKKDQENAINGKQKDSVREEIIAVSDTMKIGVPILRSAPPSEPPTEKDGGNTSRRKSLRSRSPSGKSVRQPCRDYIKGWCTRPSCDFWHPPECHFFTKKNRDAKTP